MKFLGYFRLRVQVCHLYWMALIILSLAVKKETYIWLVDIEIKAMLMVALKVCKILYSFFLKI